MPTTMRLFLHLYPLDVLQNIFSFVEVNEITQLLDGPFLSLNPSIKIAIHRTLEKGFGYFHETSRNYGDDNGHPDLRIRIPNALNREQYELVDAYCVEQQIHTTSKISYGLCHMVDLFNLVELIESLQSSDTVSLVFELDFRHNLTIDMSMLMKSFDHISDRVVELSMELKRPHVLDGDVTFKNLEVFNSHMCSVNGSFKCPKLKELVLNTSGGKVEKLPSVDRLELVYGQWFTYEDWVRTAKVPRVLHSITLRGDFPHGDMHEVLNHVNPETTIDCIGKLDQYDIDMLANAVKEKKLILRPLAVYCYRAPRFVYPCYSLDLWDVSNISVFINLPSTLKKLTVARIRINDLRASNLLDLFPAELESLTLRETHFIKWDGVLDFSRFHVLRRLEMKAFAWQSIKSSIFPESIEDLCFDWVCSASSQLNFPKNLIRVNLSHVEGPGGELADFDKSHFPSTLNEVVLFNNKISMVDLTSVKRLEKLTLIATEFEGLKLPHVDALSVEDCKKIPESYCGGAEKYLCFTRCILGSMTLKLGFCLKYLVLSSCNLSKFDVDVPGCLEEVDLSQNNLTEFPAQLSGLKRLRLLNVAKNRIHNGHIDFQTCSIEALDLSRNQIKEIKLTFPGPTKLMYLAVYGNKVTEVSDESIGCHPRLLRVE